ncbi:MAG: glycosyl hydrolase 53 family protein [Ferruginibacter sp.]
MKKISFLLLLFIAAAVLSITAQTNKAIHYNWKQFVMGADLSFVNQIEDYSGIYKVNGKQQEVYSIFKANGCNNVRVRLWCNPQWVKGIADGKLYSDLYDVKKTMRRAKQAGMTVNLDLHYSDDWADPNKQLTPEAWKDLPLEILKDSVYNYTIAVLNYFNKKNLVPEMIQVGNETNFGMLWPVGKVVNDSDSSWKNFGILLNSGIKAVRDFSKKSKLKPQIILHVAQLQFAPAWTEKITTVAGVADFDILGLSHYYKWSTVHPMKEIGDTIRLLKNKYHKKIMVVETAFPWTFEGADKYNNLFGDPKELIGYTAGKQEQLDYLIQLTQTIISAGGSGIMYWEPAWITSPMHDRWGSGSSWENAALFDFEGNVLPGMGFMMRLYKFPKK